MCEDICRGLWSFIGHGGGINQSKLKLSTRRYLYIYIYIVISLLAKLVQPSAHYQLVQGCMITCDPGTQLVVIMCCRYQIYWQSIEIKRPALRLSNPAASWLWSGEKKTRKDSTTVTVRYNSESFFLFSDLSSTLPQKTNVATSWISSPLLMHPPSSQLQFNHSLCLLLLQQPAPSDCRYQSSWGRKHKHKNKQTSDTRCNGFGRVLCTTLHSLYTYILVWTPCLMHRCVYLTVHITKLHLQTTFPKPLYIPHC